MFGSQGYNICSPENIKRKHRNIILEKKIPFTMYNMACRMMDKPLWKEGDKAKNDNE